MPKSTLSCSVCASPMAKGRDSKTDGTQMCIPCRRAQPKIVRSCVDCGTEYKWSSQTRCSQCRVERAKQRAMAAGRVCDECDKPAFNAGLCATHRSYKHREQHGRIYSPAERHRSKIAYHEKSLTKVCGFCGGRFATKEPRVKTCSTHCMNGLRFGWSNSKEIELFRPVSGPRKTWSGHVVASRSGLPLVAGPCNWCGESFVFYANSKWCSKKCGRSASWSRRYESSSKFQPSPRQRDFIRERDNWTCQLCKEPVPRDAKPGSYLYPTLDHIVPQSVHLVPDHSDGNLRLAHMICNARRGNRADVHSLAA